MVETLLQTEGQGRGQREITVVLNCLTVIDFLSEVMTSPFSGDAVVSRVMFQ